MGLSFAFPAIWTVVLKLYVQGEALSFNVGFIVTAWSSNFLRGSSGHNMLSGEPYIRMQRILKAALFSISFSEHVESLPNMPQGSFLLGPRILITHICVECMYLDIHMYIYIYIHTRMYVCMYVCVYAHMQPK